MRSLRSRSTFLSEGSLVLLASTKHSFHSFLSYNTNKGYLHLQPVRGHCIMFITITVLRFIFSTEKTRVFHLPSNSHYLQLLYSYFGIGEIDASWRKYKFSWDREGKQSLRLRWDLCRKIPLLPHRRFRQVSSGGAGVALGEHEPVFAAVNINCPALYEKVFRIFSVRKWMSQLMSIGFLNMVYS